jgi:hypothetical protein
MATAMAIDLEINKPVKHDTRMDAFTIFSQSPQTFMPAKLQPEEIEAKRAFLGCYYLSSA